MQDNSKTGLNRMNWTILFVILLCFVVLSANQDCTSLIGGSAWHGQIANNRYFVSDAGQVKEVTEFAWRLNYGMNVALRFALPVMIISILVLSCSENFRVWINSITTWKSRWKIRPLASTSIGVLSSQYYQATKTGSPTLMPSISHRLSPTISTSR